MDLWDVFHLGAILNKAAMNIFVHAFGWTYVLIQVGYIPSSGISGFYDLCIQQILPNSFLKWQDKFILPPEMRILIFSYSYKHLVSISPFNSNYSGRCPVAEGLIFISCFSQVFRILWLGFKRLVFRLPGFHSLFPTPCYYFPLEYPKEQCKRAKHADMTSSVHCLSGM